MLRHVIAPARCFTQLPNAIVRHPRLNSHAVHLLAWQLSLPPGADEPLSTTARRAKIKKTAFQNAKRQLIDAGFVHEWRVRIDGGRYAIVQLISNESLTPQQAAAVRDGHRPAPARARLNTEGPTENSQVSPSDGFPAAGQPTGRSTARLPKKNTGENTTHQPAPAPVAPTAPQPGPAPDPEPDPEPAAPARQDLAEAEAETLLRSLAHVDRRLAMPVRTARKWAPLAARWLAAGLRPDHVRSALTRGLADARSPLGALRWRLEHALPDVPLPSPAVPPQPKAEPRMARMRECAGEHTQPRLFLPEPGSGEKRCRDCRAQHRPPTTPAPPPAPAGTGYDSFLAARRALRGRTRTTPSSATAA